MFDPVMQAAAPAVDASALRYPDVRTLLATHDPSGPLYFRVVRARARVGAGPRVGASLAVSDVRGGYVRVSFLGLGRVHKDEGVLVAPAEDALRSLGEFLMQRGFRVQRASEQAIDKRPPRDLAAAPGLQLDGNLDAIAFDRARMEDDLAVVVLHAWPPMTRALLDCEAWTVPHSRIGYSVARAEDGGVVYLAARERLDWVREAREATRFTGAACGRALVAWYPEFLHGSQVQYLRGGGPGRAPA